MNMIGRKITAMRMRVRESWFRLHASCVIPVCCRPHGVAADDAQQGPREEHRQRCMHTSHCYGPATLKSRPFRLAGVVWHSSPQTDMQGGDSTLGNSMLYSISQGINIPILWPSS